ncbi:MAG: sigma-70 family RNA polymerase sigma factor [Acidobacteria bacterium]|nr:sigma-70 family RNA polymerase sigma factor [Acidobacteriota bacterium]
MRDTRLARRSETELAAGRIGPAPLPSDELLVTRILAGEADLYEALIARYERPIVNFIYRMIGDYEQALDLAQEVFFKAYRSLERFDPTFRFSTWLYRIASNRSIDHLRKQAPVLLSLNDSRESDNGPEGAIQLKSAAHGPEDLLASRELGEQISHAIDALPTPYRELILLRHLQGMSYEEIARMKRLPLGTVKNRLFRAREILRKRLES